MVRRPEVLTIRETVVVPKGHRTPSFTVYEVEHLASLLHDLFAGPHAQVGSIVRYEVGESGLIPSEVFEIFDWVICQSIPSYLWEEGGVFRPYKFRPPMIHTAKKTLVFFAGFEKARDAEPWAPSQVAAKIFRSKRRAPTPAQSARPMPPWKLPRAQRLMYANRHKAVTPAAAAPAPRAPRPPTPIPRRAMARRLSGTPFPQPPRFTPGSAERLSRLDTLALELEDLTRQSAAMVDELEALEDGRRPPLPLPSPLRLVSRSAAPASPLIPGVDIPASPFSTPDSMPPLSPATPSPPFSAAEIEAILAEANAMYPSDWHDESDDDEPAVEEPAEDDVHIDWHRLVERVNGPTVDRDYVTAETEYADFAGRCPFSPVASYVRRAMEDDHMLY